MMAIWHLNKPKITGNDGELSDLEYLPTKPEKVKYLQNAKMCSYYLVRPFKQHHSRFKQAQDHKRIPEDYTMILSSRRKILSSPQDS